MKRIDKVRKILRIVMFILVVVIAVFAILIVIPNKNKSNEIKEVETIRFDYTIYERDNKIFKDVFNSLKDELDKDVVDYEKYAEYISKLFVIDLYTLNNKISSTDIGGIQFVYDDFRENFKLNASNTLYKYINESNIEYPEVTNVSLNGINISKYKINNIEYDCYEVDLSWQYEKDLGYDKEGTIYLIKNNEELFVVEKK